MKNEIVSPYTIRLSFEPNTENPSRLFYSFAKLVDGILELDTLIAKTVNSTISSKVTLDDVEKGSILARLKAHLIISESGKIDDKNNTHSIQNYIEDARAESVSFIAEGKSSVSDLKKLTKKIEGMADENEISDSFNYGGFNVLDFAKSLNEINDATSKLNDAEEFSLETKSTKVSNIKTGTTKIDIEALEKALTEEEITNVYEVYYKIKKPDFLGDSQWEFKHGQNTIKAKILNKEWLESFQKGFPKIAPGDSLKVKIRHTNSYNKHGLLISEKIEILDVLDIKHN